MPLVAPIRGRGLKLALALSILSLLGSRPHTGAWIEIATQEAIKAYGDGRPHTGAWIEIFWVIVDHLDIDVAPIRGRGLKLEITFQCVC